MQRKYRRRAGMPPIVVGVDGSPASMAALRWALRQADRTGADVEAVSVWTPQPAAYFGAEWAAAACTGDDLARGTETVLLDTLVDVTREYGRSAPIRPRVVQGRPAAELVRAARSAQLLVLGGPARGRLAGLLLGSVSQYCVRHACCPVLIVPTETALASSRADQRAGGVMSPGRSARS